MLSNSARRDDATNCQLILPAVETREQPGEALDPGATRGRMLRLALAGVLSLGFLSRFQFRLEVVRGVDVYYHLAVAREMLASGPLQSFPWTPYSLFAEHFADKEFLFHVLLMPLAGLDVVSAGQLGALLAQVAVVAVFAAILWQWRAPLAPALLLGLCAIGPPLAVRLSMCRPHTWTLAFSLLVLALLAARRPRLGALFVCACLHGLFHSGGWLSVAFAGLFAATALLGLEGRKPHLDWKPVAATAAGWLLGQLLHPNFPANFEVLWLQNVVVPLTAGSAGGSALSAALGAELMPSSGAVVLANLPALALLTATGLALIYRPALRDRRSLTAWLAAAIFTALAVFVMRRMWELAGPLSLLCAAALLARATTQFETSRLRSRGLQLGLAAVILLGATNTQHHASLWITDTEPPVAMSRWLNRNAEAGDFVYSAQWGDSAPLLWFAPKLRSLVALDPTFLYAQDPDRFLAYAATVTGDDPDPIGTILDRFEARWLTIWRVPVFDSLSEAAAGDSRSTLVFQDPDYLVYELSGGEAGGEAGGGTPAGTKPRPAN